MKIKINTPIEVSFNPQIDILMQLGLVQMNPAFQELLPEYKQMVDTGIANENISNILQQENCKYNSKLAPNMFLLLLRDSYIINNGFVLLNDALLQTVKKQFKNKKIVDVGAGNGFLSNALQKIGVDITPVDMQNPTENSYGFTTSFTDVLQEDAIEHIKHTNYDVVLMSWPPLGSSFAHDILKNMVPGQKLIYIGEFSGCTADHDFFQLLDQKTVKNTLKTQALQKHSLNFPGITDDWYVYDII
jgi:hypothetical protein